jgi:uncharacterized protein with von Willebrand factor type A (vWA) domain
LDIINLKNIEEIKDEGEESEEEHDVSNGEFIFIIDRSGSMVGNRIKIAKQALILFIRSLPSNSKFNVCSFGSDFDYLFPESVGYSNETMGEAIEEIEEFESDYGGTDLYEPFVNFCSKEMETEYPRSVFILTDGSIENTDELLIKITENNHHIRVHSFGVGSGTSKYLVNEIAK